MYITAICTAAPMAKGDIGAARLIAALLLLLFYCSYTMICCVFEERWRVVLFPRGERAESYIAVVDFAHQQVFVDFDIIETTVLQYFDAECMLYA